MEKNKIKEAKLKGEVMEDDKNREELMKYRNKLEGCRRIVGNCVLPTDL
jgi:hypothetical protein